MSSTPRTLDDFSEHLASSYASVLEALTQPDTSVRLVRAGTGQYLLLAYVTTTTGKGQCRPVVEITSAGQPLPDALSDVEQWNLFSPLTGRHLSVAATEPLTALSAAVAELLT